MFFVRVFLDKPLMLNRRGELVDEFDGGLADFSLTLKQVQTFISGLKEYTRFEVEFCVD